MRYVWMWLFEIRSVDAQSLGEVFSSIMLASLQMLDYGRRFFLGEEIRHLAEHLVCEFAHVFVRPVLDFREREDRGELFGRQAAVGGVAAIRCCASIGRSGPVVAIGDVHIEMESDAPE